MHIVITGASSGIGASFARAFAAAGHTLTLVARRKDLLTALAAELPTKTHVAPQDLGDLENAAQFLTAAEDALGPVDVLVNNAGVQIVGPAASVDVVAGEKLLDVDLKAPLRLARAVLPGMLARQKGILVDVASMAALAPTPGMLYYNAAKAGLAAASEALRGELRGTGVHVVTVYPGIIASTAMAKSALETYGADKWVSKMPVGTEQELARRTLAAIENKHARVVYPSSGKLARWFPSTTRWVLDRMTPRLSA